MEGEQKQKQDKRKISKKIIIGVLILVIIGSIKAYSDEKYKRENADIIEVAKGFGEFADMLEKAEPTIDFSEPEKIAGEKQEEESIIEVIEKEQEVKKIVLDAYLDKIVISDSDGFVTSELEEYLRNKGYNEKTIKKAVNYGINVLAVSYEIKNYINDKSFDEIRKNLLDKKWVNDNKISSYAFTEEEIENGKKLYEYYKEQGVY